MIDDRIQFHNVEEARTTDKRDGYRLQRVPETIRTRLNEGCAERMCHPAGVEVRFVPNEPVELTLSVEPCHGVDSSTARIFWGSIQSRETHEIGTEPTAIKLTMPEQIADLRSEVSGEHRFAPRLCRVCLPGEHRGGHMYFHNIEGDFDAPIPDDLPDRRYLAYGTSITEGECASVEHLTYVNQTATRLDADCINLGSCGTAYCDVAMADHIAERDDWDVVTLALSSNMIETFSVYEFRERVANMIGTIASANPDKPVACITIYTNARDVRESTGTDERNESFRQALREVVTECAYDNVHLIRGPDVLATIDGLSADLIHPADNAMIAMGERLAPRLDALLKN
ncbi:SGNH/GDSL hydrolase family protein [Halococcus morrhuae]